MKSDRKDRVLVLVEGAKAERGLFQTLAEVYDLPFEIVPFATNIYKLFERITEDADGTGSGYLNLKDVLIEKLEEDCRRYEGKLRDLEGDGGGSGFKDNSREEKLRREWGSIVESLKSDRATLDQEFAYTYLVYDCDIHHRDKDSTDKTIDGVLERHLPILRQMVQHFTDETDETVGKLYVNYPMFESWRDADDFFDNEYRNTIVSLDDASGNDYKKRVSKRKLSGKCAELTRGNKTAAEHENSRDKFERIIRMMVFKLNVLAAGVWSAMDYAQYRKSSEGENVLDYETDLMREKRIISVLNTSLFAVLDYRGNKKGDFDRIVKGSTNETV